MGIATVVDAGLVVVRQSVGSFKHFGDVRGVSMTRPALMHVDAATWRARTLAVEQVRAEGGVIRTSSSVSGRHVSSSCPTS